MNLTRKNSPRTYRMESSMANVESRYLRGPIGSCHEHCKSGITTQPPELKTMNLLPKKVPKPPPDRRVVVGADPSVNRLKRSLSAVPKVPTRITTNVIKNNNKFVKDEGVKRDVFKFSTKKDIAIEPKSRDLWAKSQVSRTSRRRHSDIFNPNEEDMVIPLRVPTRRLSDVGSISNASSVRGSNVSKNESRKDSKLPSVTNKKSNSKLPLMTNKKSISRLPSVSIPKPVAKVLPPLRSYRSLPKSEVKGPRKLKPTKTIGVEAVPQKTPPRVLERSKTQIPISSTSLSSLSSEEEVITSNGLQESCSPSMEENTPATDGQCNEKIADLEEVGKLMVESIKNQITISSTSYDPSFEGKVVACNGLQESCSPSMEDYTPETDGGYNEKIEDLEDKTTEEVGKLVVETIENRIPISSTSYDPSSERKVGLQESRSPSMEDNTPEIDGQYNEKIEDLEDKIAEEVGKLVVETIENQISISSTSSSSSQEKVMTQEIPPSMEDDTLTKDAKRVAKLVVEIEDLSELELRFRRGKVISSHSENSSPRKLQFRQGKELEENESWKSENKRLRRLSSDGVVRSAELISHSINVDLKHQEVVEKKDFPELNKVIEETASKLIRTRKAGKVKALVGAFENITSGSNETP